MKRNDEQVEGVKLANSSINELLNPKFRDKINKLGLHPISLVLIADKNKNNAPVFPVMMSHLNSQELKTKILHLNSPNAKALAQLLKVLKEAKNAA